MKGKQQPPAGTQSVQPGPARLRDAGIDIDRIDLRQVIGDARARLHVDKGQVCKIPPGARGEVGVDLIGVDLPCRADEKRQQGGVVADPRADMQHRLAVAQRQRVETARVQGRLADIDAPAGIDRHQRVLIDESGIVVRCRHIAAAGKLDHPGPRTGKGFARHGGKGLLDPGIARAAPRRDITGEEPPQLRGAIRHCRSAFLPLSEPVSLTEDARTSRLRTAGRLPTSPRRPIDLSRTGTGEGRP